MGIYSNEFPNELCNFGNTVLPTLYFCKIANFIGLFLAGYKKISLFEKLQDLRIGKTNG